VDCGEGTQRQLLRAGAGFRRLDRVLLTHGHFDHVLGICDPRFVNAGNANESCLH
jgi:ribonuclease BN (tRNA processing enzyme)